VHEDTQEIREAEKGILAFINGANYAKINPNELEAYIYFINTAIIRNGIIDLIESNKLSKKSI